MSADSNLILGVVGLACTSGVAALGLYFTARARSAPMRELLYSKQIELAQNVFKVFGRLRLFAILLSPDSEHRDEARSDIGTLVKRLSILTDEAAALFPTELYIEVKRASDAITSLVTDFDEGHYEKYAMDQLRGQEAKVALMVRTLLGIDELSDESIRLFTKRDSLTRLAEISPHEINAVNSQDEETV